METEEYAEEFEGAVSYCATHPKVETGLACSRCGKYICPRCMIQTPVGARCNDCARVRRAPVFDVKPQQLFLAIGASILMAVGLGVAWGILFIEIRKIPFLPWLIALGAGYIIGEGISMASNRQRSTTLAWLAGIATFATFGIAGFVFAEWAGVRFLLGGIFGLLNLGFAIYIAVTRVR
jgi:hypothetical protein